jgi:PAS domain S-box-containing protein
MHRLLVRQLKRHFGKDFAFEALDMKMQELLVTVSDTYDEYDKEKRFMDNAVDLNSKELNEAHRLINQKNKNLSELLEERSRLLENRIEENKEIGSTLKQYKLAMDATLLICKFDCDGMINFVNENLCLTSGYAAEELIGENYSVMYASDKDENLHHTIMKIIEDENIYKGQMRALDKTGEIYHVNAVVFPLKDKDAKTTEYMSILQDITEIEKSRQKAQELERAKSEFLANMSHELRTPLNAIIGFSQILKTNGDLSERVRSFIDKINVSGENLLKLINSILDFSKIEAGVVTLEKIDFDMREVVSNAVDQIELKAREKGLKIFVEYDANIGNMFHGDSFKISQVLINLLSNSVKFTHDGEVRLRVKKAKEQHMYRFEIQDTGIGLDSKQQLKLFQAFTQADESTTRKYGGTGLGLTISKQLVEMMHGKIWIESKVAEGSNFIFEIELEDKTTL